ncbi:sulfatase [Prosthecobacter sp. SYSU 5D2]|uniref:sulfatase n=1 Tax=Prosthecobacter sp. SYSU 5D2 TaxID=3134134 RepID=UPI0031FE6053
MRAITQSVACFLLACSSLVHGQDKLNVLFIAVDDLRTSLGCYGDPVSKTPHLDALAKSGQIFTRAYCQQAVCNPSRQSVLSGRRPDSIRIWTLVDHFRQTAPDVVSLPQYFKEQGWFAQAFGKIYHGQTGMSDPPSWSVPEQFHDVPKGDDYLLPENQAGPDNKNAKMASYEAADTGDDAYRDGQVAAAAIQALREKRTQPFFIAVGFRKPHLPFSVPKKYWDLYDPAAIPLPVHPTSPTGAPEIARHEWKELRGYADIPAEGPLSAEKQRQLRHGYYAAVSYTDAQIGRVLEELDSQGLRDKTVVVLWSDHGFHLGEQDLWCKDTNYELATRVPLFLRVPGQKNPGVPIPALAELVDLYPTLVELCSLPRPQGLDGKSLVPLLQDATAKVRPFAISQFPRPWQQKEQPQNMGYTLRNERWRYVEWLDFNTRQHLSRELYDMQDCLIEHSNLAEQAEYAATVADLSRQLHAVLDPNVQPLKKSRKKKK